jgi:ketosteroid isomerase-like protein
MAESNVELVRHGWEAALRGDLDAIRDLLDPDVKWHAGDPSAAYACQNRDQALTFMARARGRGPLAERVELVDVVDAGDNVVVVTRRGGAEGDPGQLSANLTTFRDGRVVEMVHYADADEAIAAAGL